MSEPTDTSPFVTSDLITITPDDAVDAASGFIRALCGWHIWPEITSTVTVRPQSGRSLLLPTLNLVSLTSVTANGASIDPSTLTAWPYGQVQPTSDCESPYYWEDAHSSPWGPFWGPVTVEFVHGYEDVPATIKAVCQSLAKRWPLSATPWTSRKMGTASVSIAKGIGTSSPLGDLTVVEQMVIDKFTLPRRP